MSFAAARTKDAVGDDYFSGQTAFCDDCLRLPSGMLPVWQWHVFDICIPPSG